MKRIICLLMVAILTGCNPVNQVGISDQVKTEVKPSVIPSAMVSQKPISQEVKTPEIVVSTSPKVEVKVNSELEKVLMNSLKAEISKLSEPVPQPVETPSLNFPTPVPSYIHPSISIDPITGNTSVDAGPNISKPRFSGDEVIYDPPVITAYPIDTKLRDADIQVIFKDEYKIRLARMMREKTEEEKKLGNIGYDEKFNRQVEDFISLVDKNSKGLIDLNNLIKKYNIQELLSIGIGDSEENYEKREKESEASSNKDVPNYRSMYRLILKDSDIKSFVDELRENNLVREANIDIKPTIGFGISQRK